MKVAMFMFGIFGLLIHWAIPAHAQDKIYPVEFTGSLRAKDHDGRSGSTWRDQDFKFKLYPSLSQTDEKFLSLCAEDEVRVEARFVVYPPRRATESGHGQKVEVSAKLYEGASCDTNDLEDRESQEIVLDRRSDISFPIRINLRNKRVGGQTTDRGTVNFRVKALPCIGCTAVSTHNNDASKSDKDNPNSENARNPVAEPSPIIVGDVFIPPISDPKTCFNAVQNKIAWDSGGKVKRWSPANVSKLCKGAETLPDPAQCFSAIMHEIDWASWHNWNWQDTLKVCAGTTNANARVACVKMRYARGHSARDAMVRCQGIDRLSDIPEDFAE